MYTVKRRIFGRAADGRTVLLYAAGQVISDDDAKRVGLLQGKAKDKEPARGVTLTDAGAVETDQAPPTAPLARMRLDELRAVCDAEGIDPGDANTRAEFVAVIEAARKSLAVSVDAADGDED